MMSEQRDVPMLFIISGDEFAAFSTSTKNEILASAGVSASETPAPHTEAVTFGTMFEGVDMEDVADITPKQMRDWMLKASEKTKNGLRLFAVKPVVTKQELIDSGIDNIAHFQSRTTIRTRTVTGDKNAFLLGWDDWEIAQKNQGRYAVTPITHQSLREYFKLS